MTYSPRNSSRIAERDRRYARVRRITRGVLLGSSVSSAALVGVFAATAKPAATAHVIDPATTTTAAPTTTTTEPSSTSGGHRSSSDATPSTTTSAPTTTTTEPTCYTSPSGIQSCS